MTKSVLTPDDIDRALKLSENEAWDIWPLVIAPSLYAALKDMGYPMSLYAPWAKTPLIRQPM